MSGNRAAQGRHDNKTRQTGTQDLKATSKRLIIERIIHRHPKAVTLAAMGVLGALWAIRRGQADNKEER